MDQGLIELGDSMCYMGDEYVQNDGRDDSIPAAVRKNSDRPLVNMVLNFGGVPKGVNTSACPVPFITFENKHNVGVEYCLRKMAERRERMKTTVQPMQVNRLFRTALQTADPEKNMTGNGVNVIDARIAELMNARKFDCRSWVDKNASEVSEKMIFHYLDGDWCPGDISWISAYNDHGIHNVVFLSRLPEGIIFNEVGRKIEGIHSAGEARPVRFGIVRDVNGRKVSAVYVEGMRPEDVFTITRVIADQPQLDAEFKNALQISCNNLDPDIVDLYCDDAPEAMKNGEDLSVHIVPENTAVVITPKHWNKYLPDETAKGRNGFPGYSFSSIGSADILTPDNVRNKIRDVYARSIIRQGGGVTRLSALTGVIAGVSNLRTSANNSGIGEFPDIVKVFNNQETLQLLPFSTPRDGGSLFDMSHLMAVDIALVHLDTVPEVKKLDAKTRSLLISPDAGNDRVNRRDVIYRKMQVMRNAVRQLERGSKRQRAFLDFEAQNRDWLQPYAYSMGGRQDYLTYVYAQWLLDQQITASVKARREIKKKTMGWIDINDKNADEAVRSLERWVRAGFDGVTVRVTGTGPFIIKGNKTDLNGLCEKIGSIVRVIDQDATICARLPETIPLEDYIRHGFMRVRYYSEIAAGERLERNDAVQMDPPENNARPYAATRETWKDTIMKMVDSARSAGAIFFTLSDLTGEEAPFTADYRMPLEGDVRTERSKPDAMGFVSDIAERINVFKHSDRDSQYHNAYDRGYDLAQGRLRKEPVTTAELEVLQNQPSVKYHLDGNTSVAVEETMERGLHCVVALYEKDPTTPVFPAAIGIIGRLQAIQNAQLPEEGAAFWRKVMLQVNGMRDEYESTQNRDVKIALNAECAGFLRGINEAIVERQYLAFPERYKDSDRKVIRALLAMMGSRGMSASDVRIKSKAVEHADALSGGKKENGDIPLTKLNDTIRKLNSYTVTPKDPNGVFNAIARARRIYLQGSGNVEGSEKEIRELFDHFTVEIIRTGAIPEELREELLGYADYNDAYKTVLTALVGVFELMPEPEKRIFDRKSFESMGKEMPQVYKAVLQAA